MVFKDSISGDCAKSLYVSMLKKFNSVPMEKYNMIYHVIGSYYGRKILNKKPECYANGITQEEVNSTFLEVINKINSDFILDINVTLTKIKEYVDYFRKLTFHEWCSDGVTCSYDNLTKEDYVLWRFYQNMGYDLVMNFNDFKMIYNDSSLYRDLEEAFIEGSKHLKQFIGGDVELAIARP